MNKQDKKGIFSTVSAKRGTYLAAMVVLAIIAVVLLNVVARKLPADITKIDLTGAKMFNFTQQTKDICGALEEDVTLYFISNSDEGHSDMSKYIEQMLTLYTDLSSHIKVTTVDPALSPNFVSQYTDSAVTDKSVIVDGPKRSKVVDFYDIFSYDDYNYATTGEMDVTFTGEQAVTSAISYVISDNVPTVYVAMGHGEKVPDEGILNQILNEGYVIDELNLNTITEIPEDADCLLIDCPEFDLTGIELEMVNKFLDRGGNLLFVSDQVTVAMPNIEKLLKQFGMSAVPGVVIEGDTGNYMAGKPYFVMPDVTYHDVTLPLAKRGRTVLLRQVQAIDIDSSVFNQGITVFSLLDTSDKSYSKLFSGSFDNLPTFEKEKGDISGPFSLGAAAERTGDDNVKTRVIWLSGKDYNSDTADNQVAGSNRDMLINSLAWMTDWEHTISIRTSNVEINRINPTDAQTIVWGVVYPALLIVILISCGAIVWMRRRTR